MKINGNDTSLVGDIKRHFKERINNLKDSDKNGTYWVDFDIFGELDNKDIARLSTILNSYGITPTISIYAIDSNNIGILVEYKWKDKQSYDDAMDSWYDDYGRWYRGEV